MHLSQRVTVNTDRVEVHYHVWHSIGDGMNSQAYNSLGTLFELQQNKTFWLQPGLLQLYKGSVSTGITIYTDINNYSAT